MKRHTTTAKKRAAIVAETWAAYAPAAPADSAAFRKGWMKARAYALKQAGLITIQDDWSVEN